VGGPELPSKIFEKKQLGLRKKENAKKMIGYQDF
jgi:hypothetical protein